MKLEGSCHCQRVRFTLTSAHPYPYNLCYCSICRKTSGGGGFAINLAGDFDTLDVEGKEHVASYRALAHDDDSEKPSVSNARRNFCRHCGSALWIWDPRWPQLVHPFASAIDTDLPEPPERTHLMLASKANWVQPTVAPGDKEFDGYPDESIAAWHDRLGLADP